MGKKNKKVGKFLFVTDTDGPTDVDKNDVPSFTTNDADVIDALDALIDQLSRMEYVIAEMQLVGDLPASAAGQIAAQWDAPHTPNN